MRRAICISCLGLTLAIGVVALVFRFSAARRTRATQSECVVSIRSGSRLTDVCQYVDDLLASRECDVVKEALCWLVCEKQVDCAALGSACVALADIAVNRQRNAENTCKVVILAKSNNVGLSHAVARAYAHGLKAVIDRDESKMADRSIEEAQLNVFKSRIRLNMLEEMLRTIGDGPSVAVDRISDTIKDAQGQVLKMEEDEGRIRRGIKATRLEVTVDEQTRDKEPTTNTAPALKE